jgi:hypothetical protein
LFASTAELIAPPRVRTSAPREPVAAPRGPGKSYGGRFYVILAAVALVIGALSLLIPSTPSYDPWAWLVWGREIVHLKLHTTAGPSWKPLPVIFTTLFAPFGKAAPDLWLVVARAGAVMAAVMCFKVAWRLTLRLVGGPAGAPAGDPDPGPQPDLTDFSAHISPKPRSSRVDGRPRVALLLPLLAGLIAAGSFVNSPNVLSENALGYSEGLMTALVLIALERHLDGARRQAFVVGFFAALDRPELWLLWVPYGVYLVRSDPRSRRLVISLVALIPVLWFLPELWGSGHLFRGIARAQTPRSNSAAFAHCPFCTEFTRHAWHSLLPRVEVAALLASAAAAFGLWRMRGRRRWLSRRGAARIELLSLGVLGFAWWIGVAIETQAGFSGNDRYLVLGAALIGIAGGVGWAWGASGVARLLRGRWRVPAAVLAAVGVFLAVPPSIFKKGVTSLPATHGALVYQAHLRDDLSRAVSELGGPGRILRCGTVMTEGFQVPMVAWALGVHTVQIEAPPASTANPGPAPNVIFQARANRTAFALPVVQAWTHAGYRLVAHVRTFSVYSSCRDRVAL